MPVVLIGHEDGQVTKAIVPGEDTAQEQFLAITHDDDANRGVWVEHKRFSGTSKPAWIESDDASLAQRIANHYGCPAGRPMNEEEESV